MLLSLRAHSGAFLYLLCLMNTQNLYHVRSERNDSLTGTGFRLSNLDLPLEFCKILPHADDALFGSELLNVM